MLVKLAPLHFSLNAPFRGAEQTEFETHVTALSSIHLRDLDNTAHKVISKLDDGLRVVRSRGLAFVPVEFA